MKKDRHDQNTGEFPPASGLMDKIFDNAQVGIAITDLNQKIILINP